MKLRRLLGRFVGTLVVLALAFTVGVSFQDLRAVRDPQSLHTVLTLVPQRLGAALLLAARAQGDASDPASVYADVLATLRDGYYGVEPDLTTLVPEAAGQVGIGAIIGLDKGGQLVVTRILAGGPAARMKMQKDDVITEINGQAVPGAGEAEAIQQITDAAKLILGKPGTTVTLAVRRKNAPLTLTVPRAVVLKEIDPTQMTYNGIRGMMGAVKDRYTRFMDPVAYKAMMEDNHGEFVGIGALLGTNKAEQVYIVRVLSGGPALKNGVQSGDIILKVDNRTTLKMPDTEVVKLIRGEPGTKVTLTLQRKTAVRPVVIAIPRDVVHQEVVQHAMIDPQKKIGYIQLSVFNEESDLQIGRALTDLERQGMRGLVFDLRENPGGLLDVAQDVASRFVPSGPIVWTKSRSETMKTMESLDVKPEQKNGHKRYPLVVLVNGNSASAAEIVSGAIKDTKAGVLVGEKTFGKGLVQSIIPLLPDGSAVAITIQHYYTAHQNDINHKGIMPDVVVKFTDEALRKADAYRRDNPGAFYDLKNDPQLQKAVSVLTDQMRVASARPWK